MTILPLIYPSHTWAQIFPKFLPNVLQSPMVHLHGVVFSREAINGCTKMRVLAPISQRFISNTKFSLSLQNYHSLQLPFLLQTPFKFPSLLNPPKTLRCFLHCRATMAVEPTSNVQIKDEIHLTEKETLIFNRLKDVLHHFNLNTQLRVAGGWVRDKVVIYFFNVNSNCFDYFSCFVVLRLILSWVLWVF